jgi:predicted RNA-binding protein YlqC (UPF0109 family)
MKDEEHLQSREHGTTASALRTILSFVDWIREKR